MKTVQQLKAEALQLQAEAEAIMAIAKDSELSEEQQSRFDEIAGTEEKPGLIKSLRKKIEQREEFDRDVAAIAAKKESQSFAQETKVIKVPARAKAANKLYAFKNEEDAYLSGQWALANLFGNRKAKAWCKEHGVKANMTTFDNTLGGFLVPDPLEASIIELREQYGVARRELTQVSMSDARMSMPKLTQEVTAFYVGETQTITPSLMNVQLISLDAKKLACVTPISSELNEDSVISISEMLARSVAQTFAVEEDRALFNGTGTSVTGGIVGLLGAIQAGSLVTATGRTTFSALTFADFESMIGARKMWAANSPKWYISQAGWAASMQRLANAAGGVTMAEIADGASTMMFLGYPVVISQLLESRLTGTTGVRACYFGDLANAGYLGTRRGISLAVDTSVGFLNDTINIRATQRYDIAIHDRGDAVNSGGVIALNFG